MSNWAQTNEDKSIRRGMTQSGVLNPKGDANYDQLYLAMTNETIVLKKK